MHCKCNTIEAGIALESTEQTAVSVSENGKGEWGGQGSWTEEALYRLERTGVAFLLRQCGNAKDLSRGKRAHAHIIKSGYGRDRFLGNLLVHMYGNCGAVEDALTVFAKIHRRNVFSWNAMIAVYAQHGFGKEALQLFQQMQLEGVIPDKVTFISSLSACASQAALAEGKHMHAHIMGRGLESDVVVGTALVTMYARCGSLEDARNMFDKMCKRNVVTWNAMMAAYVQHGHGKEALQLFQQMHLESVIPDKVTYISILSACGNHEALAEGKQMHSHIIGSGFESDVVVGNALVNMYAKCGSLEDARRTFDKMPGWDVVSWNSMISVYAQHGHGKEALQLFQQMQLEGMMPDKVTFISMLDVCASIPALAEGKQIHARIVDISFEADIVVANAIVNMYGKCGSLEDARRVFDRMPKRNVVSWTTMIAAYAQHGHGKEAVHFFQQMQLEGVIPNKFTFASILDACASEAVLTEGKQMHGCIVGSRFESDVVVSTALINMYGKCGSLEEAQRVFEKMPERNVMSWTAMIAAYAQHGQGNEAVQLFQQMLLEGMIPDSVTFISILSACSHAGLLDEGCRSFVSMRRDHGIRPTLEHYNSMVDLLGRAGRLDEAEDLINNMESEPTAGSWMALLGACKLHFDVERGVRAAGLVFQLDPENAALYTVLSNIYAATGKWDDKAKVRKLQEI